jgi:hypothetical protein
VVIAALKIEVKAWEKNDSAEKWSLRKAAATEIDLAPSQISLESIPQ